MELIDGPIGTELEARGVDTRGVAWSARAIDAAPEVLAAIHRDYAAAGATIHTAATFRTRRRDVGDEWERLARRAVTIARNAVPAGLRVAGSVGPIADCWRPDLAPRDRRVLRKEHGDLARVLVDAGVDLILCETFAAPYEAIEAVEACVAAGAETWIALTGGPKGDLLAPEELAEAARACLESGARAALVNCVSAVKTAAYVEALARAAGSGGRFGAYANAGPPEPVAPAEYAALAEGWVDLGATIIGGCCYATPAHIAAVAAHLTR